MNRLKTWIFARIVAACCLVLLLALLAACGAPAAPTAPATPTAAPTQDPATIVAAVVSTLNAQMTAEALRNPTATPVPTSTPVPPTATQEPATATPTETVPPTETPTLAPAVSAQIQYVVAYPENKPERIPNEKFSLAIGFLNTGTVAWQPGYRIKLVSFQGEVTVQTEAELGRSVAPGEKGEFNLWAFGSETLGPHVWSFQMYSDQGYPVSGGSASYSYTSK